MTLGMRIRLWAEEAPRSHLVAVTVVVTLAVVGAVLAVVSDNEPARVSAVTPAGVRTPGPAGGPAAGPAPQAPTATQGTSAGTGASGPAPATAAPRKPSAPGVPVAPGATGSVDTPEASAEAPAPEVSPGGPAPEADQAVPSPPEARTASDVGVTLDTIKIGFVLYDVGGVEATGVALDARPDFPEAIKAFVDHANAEGGVHGRRIEYVTVKQDPLSQPSQRQACITMTEDEKTFAVMEAGSTIGVAANCYPEHKTPYLYGSAQTTSEDLFRQAGGYLISTGTTGTRALLNWGSFALADGFIGPGVGKLGILTDECAPDPEMMDDVFKPFLRERGVDFVEARLSCDVGIAQQQIPGAILQFRQAGVDRVLPVVIFVIVQVFLQQADAQAWRPLYSCSDMWGLCQDLFDENYPPDQWDRTRGYTDTHSGEEASGIPYSEPVQRCSRLLEDAGLPGVTNQMGRDAAVISMCDHFTLWLTAARRAPVNLTRADLIRAVEGIGEFPTAYTQRAVFGAGKYSGGDALTQVEWRRECTCFHVIRPAQPAYV